MRLDYLEQIVELTCELFETYVEPVGVSMMFGEVPSVTFSVHREGSRENDWLARVRLKNTSAVSMFRCDVYLEDVFRLCRMAGLYLVTREVYRVAGCYAMLHPLYQSQYLFDGVSSPMDYDSMMADAARRTRGFLEACGVLEGSVERAALESLDDALRIFVNRPRGSKERNAARDRYERAMLREHPNAYRSARRRKAWTGMVGEDGLLRFEWECGSPMGRKERNGIP